MKYPAVWMTGEVEERSVSGGVRRRRPAPGRAGARCCTWRQARRKQHRVQVGGPRRPSPLLQVQVSRGMVAVNAMRCWWIRSAAATRSTSARTTSPWATGPVSQGQRNRLFCQWGAGLTEDEAWRWCAASSSHDRQRELPSARAGLQLADRGCRWRARSDQALRD